MEQGTFYEICGIVASVAMILGYLPQAMPSASCCRDCYTNLRLYGHSS